jgi:uncharacterized repeat protein (TIGR01451 family)
VTANITNSTFSNNSAGSSFGGGILTWGNTTLTNNTIYDNSATTSSGGGGGGIYIPFGTTTIKNTIIANNTGSDCRKFGTLNVAGVNLDSDSTCTGFTLHGNPLVDSLANNGGPTETHALLSGSPAIDAADDTICAASPVNNLDQRGITRPQGTQCDIGAYEKVPAAQALLTVTGAGSGTGTVTATGINCTSTASLTSGDCSQSYDENTIVSLTATASGGSIFTGWGGDCSGTTSPLSVTMSADKTCTATFQKLYTLTIVGLGTGDGTVTATGINCTIAAGVASSDCSEVYDHGTVVSLTATASGGSIFTGWSNCSSSTNTSINITMDANKTCTATFQTAYTLTITGAGTGDGTVTATGINCTISAGVASGDCSEVYLANTLVSLSAAAGTNTLFTGWSNCSSSTNTSINITMDANKTCTATFQTAYTLTITGAGTGDGTVTATGINCTISAGIVSGDCDELYLASTNVNLSSSVGVNTVFVGWSGDCSGNTTSTSVTMSANKSCTAQFNLTTGTIIINKTALGNDGTFNYTATGTGLATNFSITTSGNSGSQNFSNVTVGTKSVTESSLPAGWNFVMLTCSDPDNGTTVSGQMANIDLDGGETVTCTYTNQALPIVTATKEAVNYKTGSLTDFKAGDIIRYIVVITNTGSATLPNNSGAEFTDTLTAGIQAIGTPTASSGTVSYNPATRTYSWNGSIPPGGSVTITFRVRLPKNTDLTQFCNQGTVTADLDLNGSNESAILTSDPTPLSGAPGTQTCVSVPARPDRCNIILYPRCRDFISLELSDVRALLRTQGFYFEALGKGIQAIEVQIFSLTGGRVHQSGWVKNGYEWLLLSEKGDRLASGVYLYLVSVKSADGTMLRTQVKKLLIHR